MFQIRSGCEFEGIVVLRLAGSNVSAATEERGTKQERTKRVSRMIAVCLGQRFMVRVELVFVKRVFVMVCGLSLVKEPVQEATKG